MIAFGVDCVTVTVWSTATGEPGSTITVTDRVALPAALAAVSV